MTLDQLARLFALVGSLMIFIAKVIDRMK